MQANLDVFPPDYSSHDWLFRHIGRTSTLADIGLSYGKACLAISPTLQHFYYSSSVSSQTHHYTGQGAGRKSVRCPCSLLGGRTDVGLFILAVEEIWTKPFRRMIAKSLEICHVYSISPKSACSCSHVAVLREKDLVGGVFSTLKCK